MKKIMLMALLSASSALQANPSDQIIDSYTARLSSGDHFNSSGERLKSASDILRQDRANYHKGVVMDGEDQSDRFFYSKENRDRIKNMLKRGYIDKRTAENIINGTPVVLVNIYTTYIEVYLQ